LCQKYKEAIVSNREEEIRQSSWHSWENLLLGGEVIIPYHARLLDITMNNDAILSYVYLFLFVLSVLV